MIAGREPVPAGDVEHGDLVFVEGVGALGELITRLDGSKFSHVGIATGDGRMLSCRTGSIDSGFTPDIGGVRDNSFAELWAGDHPRRLWVGRTAGSERTVAPEVMRTWADTKAADRSAFSFVKLFAVAAGLNAVRRDSPQSHEGRAEMLAAALKVGRSWDFRNQDRPAFFCAEAVAAAFGASFPQDAFEPPAFVTFDMPRLGIPTDWRNGLETLAERAQDEGATLSRLWYLARLVGSIVEHDIAFLGEAGRQLWEILRSATEGVADPKAGYALGLQDDTLPLALVTPRMLRDAHWVEWVAPIEPGG